MITATVPRPDVRMNEQMNNLGVGLPQTFDQIDQIRSVNDVMITLDRIRVLRSKCLEENVSPKDLDDICWLLDWAYNFLLRCDISGAV